MDSIFYDLAFTTEPGRVFTPRPATEELVDAVLARVGDDPARIADVGTGSGAVGIAVAVHRPGVEVVATDICAKAICLARRNALRHGVFERVHVLHADLLDGIDGPLDVVVANLPYLPPGREADYPGEPPTAVVSTGDGLNHYRRLAAAAARVLAPGGCLLVQLHGRVHELAPAALAA
jgi:release factor glutamine methyltransferase